MISAAGIAKRRRLIKAWAQRLGLIIIAAGALITVLQIFGAELWVRLATGILGVIIVLTQVV